MCYKGMSKILGSVYFDQIDEVCLIELTIMVDYAGTRGGLGFNKQHCYLLL